MNKKEIATAYLLTDLAIKNLERDLKLIQAGAFKIKDPYTKFIHRLISSGISKRRKLKQLMYQNKISIEYHGKRGDFVTYYFYLNGPVEKRTFSKYVLKKNVEEKIRSFL